MPLKEWSQNKLRRKLCVVGHGRGATSFAAHWLRRSGIEVRHEQIGPDGIVESGFSVPTWGVRTGLNQGLTRDNFTFDAKVCIVRNPWKVIATFEMIEHPCAIMGHDAHLPGAFDPLLPDSFRDWPEEKQWDRMMKDRELRVNLIARSVIDWTSSGIEYADGEFFQAEGQWDHRMPDWLECRGIAVPNTVNVPQDTVNHRGGNRLSPHAIDGMLNADVFDDLRAYALGVGYEPR